MNDKNAVIDKIISDAQAAAAQEVAAAEEKAGQTVAAARRAADAYAEKMLADKDALTEQVISRGRSVDALDARREISACKSALIDGAFAKAAQALKADKKAYKAYLTRAISSAAEDGEEVVICAEDEKTVTAAFIAGIAKAAGVKIKLAKERGDFLGGVILSGKKYDKNLTLEEELRLVRENCETAVTDVLFKGE